jgi:uncharacterized Zn finger protein
MNKLLTDLLTLSVIHRLSGSRSYARGEDYYESGRIRSLRYDDETIHAQVKGTHLYKAEIRLREGCLDYRCTCPKGTDGDFCKHLVAAGLAWLDRNLERDDRASLPRKPRPAKNADIRSWLRSLEKDQLVDMIMDQAEEDQVFADFLKMGTARRSEPIDTEGLQEAIETALDYEDYEDQPAEWEYARRAGLVVALVRGILEEGKAEAARALAEYAIQTLDRALLEMEDPVGLSGFMDDLMELHLAACRKAKPDPEQLAQRLFKWEMTSDSDLFSGVFERYHSVLGRKGTAVFRSLVEKEWQSIRPLGPDEDDSERYGRRFRITELRKRVAEISGSLDELIDVMSRDLSTAYQFLQIAETRRQAGAHELAVEWAEKGLKAFPEKTDPRLREFLAEEYHYLKRHDEAIDLVWKNFTDHPVLDGYRTLKSHADRTHQWPKWQVKALMWIRNHLAEKKGKAQKNREKWWWIREPDHSLLVEIFLWEKNTDAAWMEAKAGGCSEELWLALARLRENQHPEDALAIYKRQVEPLIDQKSNMSYRGAIRFLEIIRKLMVRLQKESEFRAYLASLCTKHKAKRNFIKYLYQKKWAGDQ